MRVSSRFWILVLLLPGVAAQGQITSNGDDLHAEIQSVYNFQPHTLTDAQIAEESGRLDQFWAKAKSRPEVYVPGLRRELANFSNPPFFLYDGSELLISLSNTPVDRKIVLAAVAHSDLRDVQYRSYFLLVHDMAAQGEDTTAAAFHILEQPKFQVYIPEHVLTLAQNFCLVYMLLPTEQDSWLRPAIRRLHDETDPIAQQSLLLLLWYAQTADSDKAIEEFSTDTDKPKPSRDYANQLIHFKESNAPNAPAVDTAASEESLRQARRERMKSVSDEALDDLDTYTTQIIAKRQKRPATGSGI